jgi:hypothetical protein
MVRPGELAASCWPMLFPVSAFCLWRASPLWSWFLLLQRIALGEVPPVALLMHQFQNFQLWFSGSLFRHESFNVGRPVSPKSHLC